MKQSEKEIGWISKSYRLSPQIIELFDEIEVQRLKSKKKDYNAYVESVLIEGLEIFKKEPTLYFLKKQQRLVKGIALSPESYKICLDLYENIRNQTKITKGQFIESILLCYFEKHHKASYKKILSTVKHTLTKNIL
ncbi:MAG: hypothetical protein Q8N88_03655 [Nanoarchaeota archaeon]|nr:hypothetical protein [Nanoarchaeota archaeon]